VVESMIVGIMFHICSGFGSLEQRVHPKRNSIWTTRRWYFPEGCHSSKC